LSHSTSPFLCWVFFKTGFHELFAWAGFKPLSSAARITGMSHRLLALPISYCS
jgi:hypothetical protein